MKKLILYASLICIGMASCSKDFLVDEENMPEWLGESIYEELKNPKKLTGSFSTYLRLIDDLGYDEVLSKTGSKTIFPANDDAFAAFFEGGNNKYGVSSYEELSTAMKKQLLYSSMLDNALLVEMLSNVSAGSNGVVKGMAIKHNSNVSLLDTITSLYSPTMPANNKYFDNYRVKGSMNVLFDNTTPGMIHFTREYMLGNGMSTAGAGSDFEIITGTPYEEGAAYVFDKKIINSNITCQNGYIHQLDGVLVPPGNMAEVLRNTSDTKVFSRVLDYLSAPFYDAAVTNDYNSWARANNVDLIDSVFAVRYFSQYSQGSTLLKHTTDANVHAADTYLEYDPGWNEYYPKVSSSSLDASITDIACMFVPTDDAMWNYFGEGGSGAYIIDNYGSKRGGTNTIPNTKENFYENLDSVFNKEPTILVSYLKNMMKASFASNVPSKFMMVTDDAGDFMGLTTADLQTKADGKYDVMIANNGVIYKLNHVIAPARFQSVMGPAYIYDDLHIMREMLNDHTTGGGTSSTLGADMYFYLMAMNSNYAQLLPQDSQYGFMYLDPTTICHSDCLNNNRIHALHFYYDPEQSKGGFHIWVDRYYYDFVTGEYTRDESSVPASISTGTFNTQIQDMLNHHTIVLEEGEKFGENHYYKTKQGAAIFVDKAEVGGKVYGGMQIQNGVKPAVIKGIYNDLTNGTSFRLDGVVQPTRASVYTVLHSVNQFEKFFDICDGLTGETDIMTWAGISNDAKGSTSGKSEQEMYSIFTNVGGKCLNYNIRMFNAYNYTLYAPTNDAVEKAVQEMGLPTWEEIREIYYKYDHDNEHDITEEEINDQKLVKAMISTLRDFVFYHFQNTSVFADNKVTTASYQTFLANNLGIMQKTHVSGGNGTLKITDVSGRQVTVNAGSPLVNIMTRDYVFDDVNSVAKKINSSSFTTVHGISVPLCYNVSGRYDDGFKNLK
jgi:uncharacterized surface protein with fasciclin (FAS1) repeats